MFFAEDCLVTDATFEDEILKIVKFIKGFALTCVCIKESYLWDQVSYPSKTSQLVTVNFRPVKTFKIYDLHDGLWRRAPTPVVSL